MQNRAVNRAQAEGEQQMSTERSQIQIVAVMGSARVNGNTATLVREALRGAAEAGASTSEIVLAEHHIAFCQGCSRCMQEGRCPQRDDLEPLRKQLHEADGVILSSPTYGAAPSAMMKNFLDRMGLFEFFSAYAFGGKYRAGIATANRAADAKKVAKHLASLLTSTFYGRGYISGYLGASSSPNGVAANAEVLRQARELGKKLARDIQSGRTYPLQNLLGRLMNRLLIEPRIRAVIVQYREGMMRGVYESLTARGLLPAQ
jgi:multimeric flavodoxin WrbA